MAKREAQYKEMSLEEGRDIRRPTEWQLKQREQSRKRFIVSITVEIHQGPVLPSNWKGDPDDYIDYWFNIEKEAGRLNTVNYPSRWIKKKEKNNTLT